ncbi:MAG: ribonuclease H-like domain-containing protein [Firmicutes bacterium]|nr:ribonuclease H-like domain-containing protein [Bacillota bacterium]
METIIRKTELDEYSSRLFDMYFGGMDFAAFDIETTGLMKAHDHVILSGFCEVSSGVATVTQYLAESIEDEALVLEATLEKLAELDMVMTYNGRRFDMPFTYTRAEALRIPIERRPFDFDLYPVVKKHSGINAFTPNLKQTTLENFMGLWNLRKDTIDGGKSVMMYYDWLSSRDDGLREKILLHNHDDVLQLYRLLSALSRVDMHAAMRGLGFPVVIPGGPDPRSEIRIVKSSELKGGKLIIEGRRPAEDAPYGPYVDYGIDGPAVKIGRDGRFRITADVSEKEGFTFIDIDALGIAESDIEEPVASSAGYLVLATPACENDLELNVISRILATRLIV